MRCRIRTLVAALVAAAFASVSVVAQQAGKGNVNSPGVFTQDGGVPALGSYKVPKTPWGEPDLQGIYNGNDLQGIPMQRAESVGTRTVLNDDEYKQRVAKRDTQVANDNSDEFELERAEEFEKRFGTVGGAVSPPPHWLERSRERQPRRVVPHRPAERPHAGADAGGAEGTAGAARGSARRAGTR